MEKKLKQNKGITLVALIITIIVMLILVAVSVNVLIKSNLIGTAEKTVNKYSKAAEEESNGGTIEINGKKYASIEDYIEGNEQYDPDGWVMAWTCADGGSWSDTIEEGGTAEGDIVAKLYKTGSKITPSSFEFNGKTCTFNEGDEYNLVIEGTGTMGALMTTEGNNITGATGWHKSTAMYMMGASDTCIMPYVSKIVVGKGIKNIGGYAFGGDTGLKKVILSSEITSIDEYAFMYCTNLTSIKIPENVKSIGIQAFDRCASLTSVTIPSSVTSIGARAFAGCISLTTVTIPSSVKSIGNYAFYKCTSLSSVTIPNGVTNIGDSAFAECTSLSSVTIPNSVTSIGSLAFDSCESLSKVKVLATNATVGILTFWGLNSNAKIYVLNDTMKTRVEAEVTDSNATVEVVTEEQMKSL
jgi:hypothetical protein